MIFKSLCQSLLLIIGAVAFFTTASAENLVILHSNDTHSTIDPLNDGTGGVLQRKAIIDSIKNTEKNVILIDAGDVVQGTLYFKYFNGDVEYPLMDMMGYDIRVLGNHEFDNGMESLARYYKETKGIPLSTNYNFKGTDLEGVFHPYIIRNIDGKKIGFIGLNIDPASIIAQKNFTAEYKDVLPVANEYAAKLKKELGCDLVVAITHIGYNKLNDKTCDIDLAENSENIDLIIGGHTHTLIDPQNPDETPSLFENLKGFPVRVAQTGKQGRYLGKLTIDLDQLPLSSGEQIKYELIPVTDRFTEENLDKNIIDFLRPYRAAVDSVNNVVVAYSEYDLDQEKKVRMGNLTADFAYQYGRNLVDSLQNEGLDIPNLDMAIMNVGGIRHSFTKGGITEGQVLSTYPFSNHIVLISVKGEDIIEAMRISAAKGGEAISGNVRVITDPNGMLKRVVIDGKEMIPEQEYLIVTIDYVAEGNDDLTSLAKHRQYWVDEEEVSVPILQWFKSQSNLGLKIAPDLNPRFVIEVAQDLLNH